MTPADHDPIDPRNLGQARLLCHVACQLPALAARANLTALEDDSHANLGWSEAHKAFVSRVLDTAMGLRVGFGFEDSSLLWIVGDSVSERLPLARSDEPAVAAWLDGHLSAAGLRPTAGVAVPYTFEETADYALFTSSASEVRALGSWFARAHRALGQLIDQFETLSTASVSVRCWPHHFDIACLFTLEGGDPEEARSIGVGMSPGDGSYAEPYFYCTPWPLPDVAALPEPPAPFAWHTEGFVSMIATAGALPGGSPIEPFLREAVTVVRALL